MTGLEATESEPRTDTEGTGAEDRPKLRYALLRPARDACVAFGLFVLVSLALSSGPSSASPHRLLGPSHSSTLLTKQAVATTGGQQIFNVAAKRSTAGDSVASRQTGTADSWLLLSLAFSLLAALNMALVRHLREVYVNPRRNTKD